MMLDLEDTLTVKRPSSIQFNEHLVANLAELQSAGRFKIEHSIASKQGREIKLQDGKKILNFCANNYLGLASNSDIADAAISAIEEFGYGLASVRFICGTQSQHALLEERMAHFLSMDNVILFPSCFDANTGFFEALFGEEDAVISDALNHASIIDGVRLCPAKRYRYANNDMQDLERCLRESENARFRVIVTDGVFSMDGVIADLASICDLADQYNALVYVDDSHGIGVLGKEGRGTTEACDVKGRVDVISGTFGKALGGAAGGFIASSNAITECLKQNSRPYLFSNNMPPNAVGAALKAIQLIESGNTSNTRLIENTRKLRANLVDLGFTVLGNEHPIIPVLIGDANTTNSFSENLYEQGLLVVPFSFPVVPRETARLRIQLSSLHTPKDIDRLTRAFRTIGQRLKLID